MINRNQKRIVLSLGFGWFDPVKKKYRFHPLALTFVLLTLIIGLLIPLIPVNRGIWPLIGLGIIWIILFFICLWVRNKIRND